MAIRRFLCPPMFIKSQDEIPQNTQVLKENGSTYDLVGSEQGLKGDDGWKAVVLEMSRTVLGLDNILRLVTTRIRYTYYNTT